MLLYDCETHILTNLDDYKLLTSEHSKDGLERIKNGEEIEDVMEEQEGIEADLIQSETEENFESE